MQTIYFDHAATTPLDGRVLAAMQPYLTEQYGNADSRYFLGRRAALAVLSARDNISSLIGGSGGNLRQIVSAILEKNPKARIVATAISLESMAEMTHCMKGFSFAEREVVSISVARDRKAGGYHLMMGQNPITIFTMAAGGERV